MGLVAHELDAEGHVVGEGDLGDAEQRRELQHLRRRLQPVDTNETPTSLSSTFYSLRRTKTAAADGQRKTNGQTEKVEDFGFRPNDKTRSFKFF